MSEIHQGPEAPRHREETDDEYAERTGLRTHADYIARAQELAREMGLDGDPGTLPEVELDIPNITLPEPSIELPETPIPTVEMLRETVGPKMRHRRRAPKRSGRANK